VQESQIRLWSFMTWTRGRTGSSVP